MELSFLQFRTDNYDSYDHLGLPGSFLSGLIVSSSHAQFRELTKRIPDDANTIIFIDVKKLQNSPLGKQEDWRGKQEKAFDAGLEMVPPQALEFVAAAKLNLHTKQADWEVGLMKTAYDPSVAKVAVRYQGTVDKISNRSVAVIPGNIFVVKFMENVRRLRDACQSSGCRQVDQRLLQQLSARAE